MSDQFCNRINEFVSKINLFVSGELDFFHGKYESPSSLHDTMHLRRQIFLVLLPKAYMNSMYFVYNLLIFSQLFGSETFTKTLCISFILPQKNFQKSWLLFEGINGKSLFLKKSALFPFFPLTWKSNVSWAQDNASCSLSLASHWKNSKLYILTDSFFSLLYLKKKKKKKKPIFNTMPKKTNKIFKICRNISITSCVFGV